MVDEYLNIWKGAIFQTWESQLIQKNDEEKTLSILYQFLKHLQIYQICRFPISTFSSKPQKPWEFPSATKSFGRKNASLLRRAQELVAQDVKPFLRRRVEQTLLRHLGALKKNVAGSGNVEWMVPLKKRKISLSRQSGRITMGKLWQNSFVPTWSWDIINVRWISVFFPGKLWVFNQKP